MHPPLGPAAPDPVSVAVTVRRHDTTILHNVHFQAGAGEFVAIIGPNGAGKTTLLRALAGLEAGGRPDPRTVGYLEQGARSAWPLRVRDLVALGRIPHNDANAAAIARALERTGSTAWADRAIDTLSGGEARRVMLARVLAGEPRVLLLDEPVADLDPPAAHAIMALLRALAGEGRCVIAVLHALDLVMRYATRTVVLEAGRIVADGPPAEGLIRAAASFGMSVGRPEHPGLLPPD